ncbi:hypothetical protein [Streptomyces sp. NPDC101455]|uniref:hypothetical protein n=1 Tax=Streptomyces sp. NPDC101455 TaxID=3366142 RepID=UPI00382ADC5B
MIQNQDSGDVDTLHPPTLGALYDALLGASRNTQVIAITHSADLLDNPAAQPDHLLIVRNDSRGTIVGPVDRTGRRLLAEEALTLPDLLRNGKVHPQPR